MGQLGRTDIVQRATIKVETLLGGHFPDHLASVDRRIQLDRSACPSVDAPGSAEGAGRMTRIARVVIIGGGAVGCSALYHLALRGWTDCLLLEMNELTSGSTWHAAGNCPTFSGSWTMMKMQAYGAKLYRRLSAELEGGIGYHGTGSIRLAHHRERMDEFRHIKAMAQAQGLAYDLLSPTQARELYPFLEPHDLEGVLWDPLDGDVDPSQLTQAYAKLAREAGCRIERFTRVTSLARGSSGEWLVGTDKGETVRAEIVVNASGYRAGEIMALLGQSLPIVAMQHQYLVTEDIPALVERGQDKLPLLRDPTSPTICARSARASSSAPTSGSAAPWRDGIPADFAYQLWPDDLGRLEPTSRTPVPACQFLPKVASSTWSMARSPTHQMATPISARHRTDRSICLARRRPVRRRWQVPERVGGRHRNGWSGCSTAPLHRLHHGLLYCLQAIEVSERVVFPFEERRAGRPRRGTTRSVPTRPRVLAARDGWETRPSRPRWRDREPTLACARDPSEVVRASSRPSVRPSVSRPGGFSIPAGGWVRPCWTRLLCSRLPKVGRIGLCYALDTKGGVVTAS